jgi:predicted flavoprotein YhiN
MHIEFDRDYVGQNLKSLPGVFHNFGNQDMLDFLHSHGIQTVVEDNGRVILKSGKSKELLDLLMKLATENGVETINSVHIQSVNGTRETDNDAISMFKIITNQ